MRVWLLGLLISIVALVDDAPATYFGDVRPVLQRQCQGRGPAFNSGAPAQGLILKYVDGETQARMPRGGSPPGTEQIATLAAWIATRAKDDKRATAKDALTLNRPPVFNQPPLISALAFSPDGKTLAVSCYRKILIHKVDGGGAPMRRVGLSEGLNGIAFSPDGSTLIAAGSEIWRFGSDRLFAQRQTGAPQRSSRECLLRARNQSRYDSPEQPEPAARTSEKETGNRALKLRDGLWS